MQVVVAFGCMATERGFCLVAAQISQQDHAAELPD
jgi:hypothetical protein